MAPSSSESEGGSSSSSAEEPEEGSAAGNSDDDGAGGRDQQPAGERCGRGLIGAGAQQQMPRGKQFAHSFMEAPWPGSEMLNTLSLMHNNKISTPHWIAPMEEVGQNSHGLHSYPFCTGLEVQAKRLGKVQLSGGAQRVTVKEEPA